MKLGIFGDSFASDQISPIPISGEPWVNTLTRLLDADYSLHALHGTSIWWSFKNFLKHYKNFTHIVFVYSQHNRWPFLQKQYESMHHITSKQIIPTGVSENEEKSKIAKILLDAYPIVNDEEFDLYMYQKIFNDVNYICEKNNITLINFMPFDNGELLDYSAQKGFRIYNAIELLRYEQTKLNSKERDRFIQMMYTGDLRYCHMNWKNNKLVATRMFENFTNTNLSLDIMKDKEVSCDPECLRELFYENRN